MAESGIGQRIVNRTKEIVSSKPSGMTDCVVSLPGGGLEGLMIGETSISSFLKSVADMNIGDFPTFNEKNYAFMLYLMQRNISEYYTRIFNTGIGAYIGGDSSVLPSVVPFYAQDMNYSEFANNVGAGEKYGVDSTRTTSHYNKEKRTNITNLYPDDNDSGQIGNVWNLSGDKNDNMKNSILWKTKELFRQNKINTIISRFATSADGRNGVSIGGGIVYNGQVATDYGESHGRNLLTKDAETKGGSYDVHGYNNPYCRVWTHHHQYNSYNEVMRPVEDVSSMQTWPGFGFKNKKWGWRGGQQSGWEHSVLNKDTGFLNIAPSYGGGSTKNIHPKQCMFSLENLAWKGYDPYSFEQALSWEQRGPLGGRIMWFPPYGISFSETSTTEWNKETFIGRGEEVFTYKNTRRTGTLNFMLVVDHPSTLDYATWYGTDHLNDNDVHRYFAGCDTDVLQNAVKPTPLTDETTDRASDKVTPSIGSEQSGEENDDNALTVNFYAFFPNNYSGVYDMPQRDLRKAIRDGNVTEEPSGVNAIAYLLAGTSADSYVQIENGVVKNEYHDDLNMSTNVKWAVKIGYEMSKKSDEGLSSFNTDSYIVGNKTSWQKVDNENSNGKEYVPDEKKKWYYRIDGEYIYPKNESDGYMNTYGQTLTLDADYKDITSYQLNLNIEEIKKHSDFCSDSKNLYSLAEVVFALMQSGDLGDYDDSWYDYLESKLGVETDMDESDRIEKLTNMFSSYKLKEIKCEGYSNKQGEISDVHEERNKVLAENRGKTIIEMLKSTSLYSDNVSVGLSYNGEFGSDVPPENVNDVNAKLWRSAKCTLVFQSTETDDVSDTNQGNDEDDKSVSYYHTGEYSSNGKEIFSDEQGGKWIQNDDGDYMEYSEYVGQQSGGGVETNILNTFDADDDNAVNKYRYDQEYHFFQELKRTDEFKYNQLLSTIKYFNPAYHSMTPEGFNARLTFLHQCTRQGDTTTASDSGYGKTANNLAFGRPPFCVLRLGDFFNQLIVIESINFTYLQSDGTVWDLNNEGAGVQPMLAQVAITFSFIGGADIAGPVRRLQNAMSFNYYANTSLYDNRADRTVYSGSDIAMGGAGNGEPLYKDENYYTHVVGKYNGKDDNENE